MSSALRLTAVLLCLAVVNLGCKSGGSSSGSSKSSSDPEKALIESRHAAWPATNGGYSYFTGRTRAKFKAMMALKNGATGAVVKSSRINQSGHESNDELMEEAAEKFARMLKRSRDGR